ncbi:MAG TPA: flippase-like domain-containing protein [Candidatus Bathyarchaeota archaeon]|nr:flippase-like domain-containing protein [Candidatus Bathyarchaeota archaeon]
MRLRPSKTLIFALTGLIIFLIYFMLVNPLNVLNHIRRLNLAVYAIAVAIDYLGLLAFGVSWYILLRGVEVDVSLKDVIGATLFSLFMLAIFPIPMGSELIRMHYIKDKKNSSSGKAVATVLVHRIMYNLAFMLMITLAVFIVKVVYGYKFPVQSRILLLLMGFAGCCIAVFAFALNANTLKKIYNRYSDKIQAYINKYLMDYAKALNLNDINTVLEEIEATMRELQERKLHIAAAFAMTAFHWTTGAITAYLVARALNFYISFWLIVALYAVVEFIQEINIVIPGGVGIIESSLTMVFIAVGVPLPIAAAITILTRLATYWLEKLLCGLVSVYFGFRTLDLSGLGKSLEE